VTWTKLGEEWSDAARDLSDAAYRTHVDALCWSNRRGLDLVIPKRDLKRFTETDDPDTAVKELAHAGWWEDQGHAWWVGVHFPDWQVESVVVTKRREQSAITTRRSRLHHIGDHSMCLPKNCPALRSSDTSQESSHDVSRERSPGTVRNGAVRTGEGSFSSRRDQEREGEGGPGGEPTYPNHCPRHSRDPEPPPCRACGEARQAREAAEAARTLEQARRPQEICPLHRLPLPCRGCAADDKAAN
jgi:hypothetical protein